MHVKKRLKVAGLGMRLLCLVCFLVGIPDFVYALTPPAAVNGLTAWYDISSASNLTTKSVITSITDKSGNGNTLNSDATFEYPAYTASALNGLSAMQVSSGVSGIMTSSFTPTTMNAATILSVHAVQSNTGGDSVLVASWPTGGNDYTSGLLLDENAGGEGSFATRNFMGKFPIAGANFNNYLTSSIPFGTYFIERDIFNSTSTSLGINGTTEGSEASTASGSISTTNFGVGMRGTCCTSTADGNDSIGEILVYKVKLSTANYQELEGYLACKWGLQAQLPAGHPYHASCPPGGFLPTSVASLAAWWDLSDSSSFTKGTVATQVTDKSGNGNTLTNTGGPEPTFTVVGGNNALVFTGNQYVQTSTVNTFATGTNPSTMFAVAGWTGGTATSFVASYGNNGNLQARGIGTLGDSNLFAAEQYGGVGAGAWATTPTLVVGIFGTSTAYAGVNGTPTLASNSSSPNTPANTNFDLGTYLGNSSYGWIGPIYEVLVYNTVPSTAERQFIEGYLACKWGIQSSLPAGHPFKTQCPATATPALTLLLSVAPTGNQPPGTSLTYSMTFTNSSNTIVYNPYINATIPTNTTFRVGSDSISTGSTGLSSATSYSNNGGTTYTYTPVSGGGGAAAGYDATVTNIRWTLSGAMSPASSMNSGSISYGVAIK